ncbi:hypothetical protein BJV74DRAFT_466230 [Russula compacta]|nr:hypothetical protein BJV74DRAFT_466230 [Russula compacta]
MSPKCHLLDLPDEVLLFVAIKLLLTDLLSFMRSCRRLSVVIAESPLMQYLIRTMRNGLYDPLVSDMSIPQRFKALDTWERAWLELSVDESPQNYPLLDIGLYDPKRCRVQSGILFVTQFSDLYFSGDYYYLDFLHLIEQSKGVARINIPNIGGDAHVQSWTYAPESDLLAIIFRTDRRNGSSRLQFHQFSTGSIHPSATNYRLEFNQISATRATCVECCGDNMVVVILGGEGMGGDKGDYIFLVEWKLGHITQLRKAPPGTYGALVTFLSRDVLVFALQDAFALQICKLNRAGDDAAPTLETLYSLRLPSLLPGQQIADIRLTQPSPLSGSHPSPQHSLSAFPFRSDPEHDILAFDVYFRDDHGRRIIFVARRRTLLSLASPSSDASVPPPTTRAWEDWGPRATHWMELDPLNDSISLAGSRCVLVKYSHLRGHYWLDLRDFNPHRVRARDARLKNHQTATAPGISAPVVLSAEACFEEDVVSELPFVSIRKENVGSRVLLDDEWMADITWDPNTGAPIIQFRTIMCPREPCAL